MSEKKTLTPTPEDVDVWFKEYLKGVEQDIPTLDTTGEMFMVMQDAFKSGVNATLIALLPTEKLKKH